MKTIDELGISPTPWDYQPNHPDGCRVATAYNCDVSTADPASARLIASAPELYKALYDIVEYINNHSTGDDDLALFVAPIAEEAIAKASGEEVK